MNTKHKGDLAETQIIANLIEQGHRVAIPFGENWRYDLIVDRAGSLECVQVEYVESDGEVLTIRCYSSSVKEGGRVVTQKYTADEIDWIAVYDASTRQSFYCLVGTSTIRDRSRFALSCQDGQTKGVRLASDYTQF